ncbi:MULTISPECIES: phage tail protein [unclassified Photorhabdus]|uniref:phage tail protein n=1 Tax=unclassified Photorhabdus TaxID=2620880 RepID=UPI000DCC4895|nr:MULTISPECIES: phage tail protein [unclassified Photorhabdus]RAX01788.1 hypothetical protein CKY03_05050 [Photorhabdus sp. S9-53]RAX02453.1 hypothetical protein CKY05_04600 [Photorhabdus sp. S10-54]RAX05492.1 hypothetical protein CKY04_04595 [Photorhabdus sp. S8-52]
MANKDNPSNSENNLENANIKSTGPSTNDLKSRFKEGSIPLQTDYSDLIDIADIGRKATGQAPGQSGEPGDGLSLTDNGTLQTVVNSTGGLHFDKKALAIKPYDGINVDNNGVSVKAGSGIIVDSSGVSIDSNNVLPKGIIVMFSGSDIPDGWALCDGKNDTPDLIDRFILGGKVSDINKNNGKKASGLFASNKQFKISTTNKELTITIKGTKLSLDQIPEHNHIGGTGYFSREGARYDATQPYDTMTPRRLDNNPNSYDFTSYITNKGRSLFVEADNYSYYFYTSNVGDGNEHTHDVDASANIIPPYYILAFIMKI